MLESQNIDEVRRRGLFSVHSAITILWDKNKLTYEFWFLLFHEDGLCLYRTFVVKNVVGECVVVITVIPNLLMLLEIWLLVQTLCALRSYITTMPLKRFWLLNNNFSYLIYLIRRHSIISSFFLFFNRLHIAVIHKPRGYYTG